MKRTLSGVVACEPFGKTGVEEAKTALGVSFVAQAVKLTKLKVLVGNESIAEGSYVYVLGKDCTALWAKNPVVLDGITMIMVPVSSVLVIEAP